MHISLEVDDVNRTGDFSIAAFLGGHVDIVVIELQEAGEPVRELCQLAEIKTAR